MHVQSRMFDSAVIISVNGDFNSSVWPAFEQDFKEIIKRNPLYLIIHFTTIQTGLDERIKMLKRASEKLKTKLVISCSTPIEGFDGDSMAVAIKRSVRPPLAKRLVDLLLLEEQKRKIEKQLKQIDVVTVHQLNALDEKQKLEEPVDEEKLHERTLKLKREMERLRKLQDAFKHEIDVLLEKESATGFEIEDPMSILTPDQKKAMADAEAKAMKAIKDAGVFV